MGSSAWASFPRLGGRGADLRSMIQHPTVPDPSILAHFLHPPSVPTPPPRFLVCCCLHLEPYLVLLTLDSDYTQVKQK